MLDTTSLVDQLVTVELSVAHESPVVLRAMLRDIQFAVAELQQERLEMLRELARLRQRRTEPTHTSLVNMLRAELRGLRIPRAARGKG
ncbi:MAG TPA: hypothetical protein VME68_19265 [Acidobacteriaceae bacterium]|nr:hypothetical protein [Acidobacteriaceae bacterium]